jgi:hypothetical protein
MVHSLVWNLRELGSGGSSFLHGLALQCCGRKLLDFASVGKLAVNYIGAKPAEFSRPISQDGSRASMNSSLVTVGCAMRLGQQL